MASCAPSASCAAARSAYVAFPGAPYTHARALAAARRVLGGAGWAVVDGLGSSSDSDSSDSSSSSSSNGATLPGDSSPQAPQGHALYFADYDVLPFSSLLGSATQAQCSSYVIRKALIRKHHLAHALHAHALKTHAASREGSSLLDPRSLTPKTWIVELQFADELDELLLDELYDLKAALDAAASASEGEAEQAAEQTWYILKPGMADRGHGIRLFHDEAGLRAILEDMEEEESESEQESDGEEKEEEKEKAKKEEQGDGGMLGQLRHFVIQEYLSRPLLLSPSASPSASASAFSPRKFHLRAYVLCVGGLRVYLYDSLLALFAPLPYASPQAGEAAGEPDPRVHLSNTCLHADGSSTASGRPAEENVHLFSDLIGSPMLSSSSSSEQAIFTQQQHDACVAHVAHTLGAVFEAAARANSVHWQTWPNAWEVFGVDLLLGWEQQQAAEDDDEAQEPRLRSWLLEVNAQPDFAQSGAKLQGVVEQLFVRALQLAVLAAPQHTPACSSQPASASASAVDVDTDTDAAAPAPAAAAGADGATARAPAADSARADAAAAPWPLFETRDGMRLCLDAQLSKAW